MPTPYITPAMLTSRPAGISWNTVPTLTADSAAQLAQLQDVCWSATSTVDTYCRQPLRATVKTDTSVGPGLPRVAVDRRTRATTLVTEYRHLVQVAALQVSQFAAFPAVWNLVPAGQYRPRQPVVTTAGLSTGPIGGNRIDVAPGHIDWTYGRGGWQVQVSYLPGWPHTSLTAPVQAGATSVQVDDVTGWSLGWTGRLYDGTQSETVAVTDASATQPVALPNGAGAMPAGPGTITLATPLVNPHPAGAVVSALPPAVLRAAALAATVEALETIDAIATQSLSGQFAGGAGVLAEEVEMILDDYRRII